MSKDRIIITVCLALTAGLLTAAATLMDPIREQREELQLTAHDDVLQNMPPEIAFTQAALGSFRGIAVNMLWLRVQQMQQDGDHYEAMQLADWITKLQPRFSQVWIFHAWNMAYNISVSTHTPQERWMWVHAGIRLLRDEAIPLNPRSVELHRQLGLHYLHKVGGYQDDMHQHYKTELASKWHGLLGEPPQGVGTEEVLEWFRPIAEMYEAYVNERELGYAVREELQRLAGDAELRDEVREYSALTIHQLETRLRQATRRNEQKAEALGPLRARVAEQIEAARPDPVRRVQAGDAEVAEQLERLRERGFRPDQAFVRRVAAVQRDRSTDVWLPGVEEHGLGERDEWLREWLEDESIADVRDRVLGFARARVLYEEYRMDPIWMFELMRGAWFGPAGSEAIPVPIDWRHPAAHGMYWSSLGVRRNSGLLRPQDFEMLNTDRQVIHSLQELMRTGHLVFDPGSRYHRTQPDPRYIDAYSAAVFGASERQDTDWVQDTVALESFQAGHENFLRSAVEQAYYYGERSQAERYYRTLRELYMDRGQGRAELYTQPLDEFVISHMLDDDGIHMMSQALSIVSGMMMQAIDQGLASGRRDVADRFLQQARRAHNFYNSQRAQIARSEAGDRLSLPAYEDMLGTAFSRYLMGQDPLRKARAWQNAPEGLKRRVYDSVREPLYEQAERAGLRPERMFPEPEGMAAYRERFGVPDEDEAASRLLQSLPDRR